MSRRLLDLSSALISVPSTADNLPALTRVLQIASKPLSGFTRREFSSGGRPSLLFSNRPGTGKFKILLNAHLDVVAAKPAQYRAIVKNGRLFGRGAIDMKAAAAAEILAFREVAKKVKYPLALQLVTDEETGGFHGTKYQISRGIKTGFYLCGEVSNLGIGHQTKGVLWLKITTHGKRAHGAYLWKGTNSITRLNRELLSIGKLFPVPAKESWITTCNISVISAGEAVNQVPDEAFAKLDIRRIPEVKAAEIIKKIKSNLIFKDTRIEIIEDQPANYADPANPYLKSLSQVIKSHTRKPVKFIKFHGASDARYYSSAGAVAIDFGPAGDGLHSDTEWVDLKSLEAYYQILVKFLLSSAT